MKGKGHPTVFWDFDGTLAHREGHFSGVLWQILNEHVPEHGAKIEDLRPHLSHVFPWHNPDQPHLHLSDAKVWWSAMEKIFARTFAAIGLEGKQAEKLAELSHERYIDPAGFKLYPDTIPALSYLWDRGWHHIIVSNHVPELPQIVEGLGLDRMISQCITSAAVGYEKPNPEIYRIALELADHPEKVWMVGDNPHADIIGAERVGIRAILVRGERREEVKHQANTLLDAAYIIDRQQQ